MPSLFYVSSLLLAGGSVGSRVFRGASPAANHTLSSTGHHAQDQPGMTLAVLPMHLYRQDCWKKRPVSRRLALLETQEELPGAGIGEVVPYETVLKDGYHAVECTADYMDAHGDKYGNEADAYKLGDVSNVSIVRYSVVVPEEDREHMDPSVCFAFCRTVPDMLFFGIRNGHECYCEPYYKPMASDDSMCDVPCEGDATQTCGGVSKSSIFSMHMCNTLANDLAAAKSKFAEVTSALNNVSADLDLVSGEMQSGAAALQDTFGQAGDPAASDLMQSAKAFAGDLEHGSADVATLLAEMGTTEADLTALESDKSADPTSFAFASQAEASIAKMEQQSADGMAKVEDMEQLLAKANATEVDGASKQYLSVMYFVDREFEDMPSTCAGKAVGKPLVGSLDGCAAACDADVHSCVGFSYFVSGNGGLCFLLSKFKTVQYYSGCDLTTGANSTQCMAKLSKFQGTSLKPDGSGKCKQCFKEATKADRCFG